MKEKPKEILNFYKSLEKLKSLNVWNIQNELYEIKNIGVKKWDDNLITERKILTYNINKGKLVSNIQITDIKGKILNTSIFSEKEINYIKERLSETSNSWVLSRYAHILWNETKHNSYAEIAIDNYINSLERIQIEETNELSRIISAFLFLSKKTKRRITIAKDSVLYLLNEMHKSYKSIILQNILDNNILDKKELNEIAKNALEWIDFDNPVNYYINSNSLNVIKKLFNQLNKPTEEIYELLAINENIILDQHQDEKDFVHITTVGRKLMFLKKANNKLEYEKVSKLYNKLKQKVKLSKVSYKLEEEPTKMLNEYINNKANLILEYSTEAILDFFASNNNILVDHNENIAFTNKQSKKNLILNTFNVTSFDINTNFKELSDNEKFENQLTRHYEISNSIRFFLLFYKIFSSGIVSGKLNYYKVYKFLETHTWFGIKFNRSIAENEINKESNWLSLLAPGIYNLFSQFELSVLMNTNKVNNYILSLDSLTLKFEGALRDFIRLSGGSTTKIKDEITQEQLLDELLKNEITKEYFSDRDIELFNFAFSKKGKNLRNNIAHSFMEYSDYNLQSVSLVFFCILRLGKYTFEVKETCS